MTKNAMKLSAFIAALLLSYAVTDAAYFMLRLQRIRLGARALRILLGGIMLTALAVLGGLAMIRPTLLPIVALACLAATAILITFLDLRLLIIPDALTLNLALSGLVLRGLSSDPWLADAAMGAALGSLVMGLP